MTTKKLTKEQRAEREDSLVLAILNGLVATVRETAKSWAIKARDLREGLSATAIKRAERKAHKLAEEKPPGIVKAMEGMEVFDQLCRHHKISKREQDAMWAAACEFCMFQLAAGAGPFYEAARYYGLAVKPPEQIPVVAVGVTRKRTPGCNCPNCRPRTAEELN